jgi:hypothetical protein
MALGAVGGLIVVVLVLVAVAAMGGGGGKGRLEVAGKTKAKAKDAAADGHGRSASTATTYALVPVTGGAPLPTTTAKPPPKPPPPPPDAVAAAREPTQPTVPPPGGSLPNGTAAPQQPPALHGDGAVLVKPRADPAPARSVDKAKGCYSAADPGWRIVDCGALKRPDVVLLWLTEQHPKTKGLRALVLRERTPGQWATVLQAMDDDATRFTRIGVSGEDASGDGRPELVFGFHLRTPDKALAIDVVEAPGATTLHRDLPGPATSVRAQPGQLDTWATQDATTAVHQTIKVIAGGWRVAATETAPRSGVPPSMV